MEKPAVKVSEKLMAKNDGRKRAWWVKKIEELEAEVAWYKNGAASETTPSVLPASEVSEGAETVDSASYASGFIDCMHKFQILNKVGRARLRDQIIAHGPGAVKNLKNSRFRGMTL